MNKIILGIFCLCVFKTSQGQEKLLAKAEESFKEFAYVDARKVYLDVIDQGYRSADVLKKIGDSYYFNGELDKATKWYEELILDYKDEIDSEYMFRYAQCLKSIKKYQESDQIMLEFNTMVGSDQRAGFFMTNRDYLKFIDRQSGKFRLLKLSINSKFPDYSPSFDNKGRVVFASSRNSVSKAVHEWNKMPFLDLFTSEMISKNGILKRPKRMNGKINSRFHESSSTFTRDGKTVYFTRNNYSEKKLKTSAEGAILLKIYKAQLVGNKWENIEELPFNSDEYSVAHPTLSLDGKKLYFASDMPGGKGKSDLYEVEIHEDGTFGAPKNLGDRINTEGRETFPFVSDSGKLYFSSDGHTGLGGLDIFVSVPEQKGWGSMLSIPYNIGRPVNGPEDDFSFIINENTGIGYFASNRPGGKGYDDIYSVKQTEELITSCQQYVSGVISEAFSEETVANAEIILLSNDYREVYRTITDSIGNYEIPLACGKSYIIRAKKDSYSPKEFMLETNDALEISYNIPLKLRPGGLNRYVEVKPGDDLAKLLDLQTIYFDSGKSVIRPDAEIELQKIIAALKNYPKIIIEVKSHTDSRSRDGYNMELSNRRARSTLKYIMKNGGLSSDRVFGRGYGETELLNKCANGVRCSENQHQLNRRSEFIVRMYKEKDDINEALSDF